MSLNDLVPKGICVPSPHPYIDINGRRIGPGHPTYIVAEMSGNHNQDFDRAVGIIEAAKEAGSDAIKLQTYTADTLTIDCDNEYFKIKGTVWENRMLYELYRDAYTPWEWQPKLKQVAAELGLTLFSTPFDATAVDFLETIHVPAYKVASFENGDLSMSLIFAQAGLPKNAGKLASSPGSSCMASRTLRKTISRSGPLASSSILSANHPD